MILAFKNATIPSQCFTDIDDCVSNPCKFNGTCVDKIADYTCDCIKGFRGKDCEESKSKNLYILFDKTWMTKCVVGLNLSYKMFLIIYLT